MKKARLSQKTEFHSVYGTVIVYARRHINGCKFRDPNNCSCGCPKWIYAKPRGGRAVQKAAGTPSFTEACEHAHKILKGFDPEIAAARKVNEPKLGITIEDAITAYEASLRRRELSEKYVDNCLQPLQRRDAREYKNGRALNVSLLDYLDRANLAAREPVTRMEQLNSDHLDAWAATWKTNDASSHLWRSATGTFMRWGRLHDHLIREPEFREPQRVRAGNRCGFFSNEQYAKLRQALPFYRMKDRPMPANYAARLGAFMDAGRWAGMAIIDIVFFSPRLSLGDNDVLTYRRRKSGVVASVLLAPEVAARLRSIPAEEGSDPERPFRFSGSEAVNAQLWRARFKALCAFAGVTEIETENGRKVEPHPHALRDTCAIDSILRGVSLENVAKLLGHATTQMTQRSYLLWIKQRIDYSIEDQRRALERRQAEPEAESPEPDDVPPALVQ